jgi:hypothetical protein
MEALCAAERVRLSGLSRTEAGLKPADPLWEKYPEIKPFIADPILHMTLARVKDLDSIEKEFYLEYGNHLPIQATAREVCLYEIRDNIWHKRNSFRLSGT